MQKADFSAFTGARGEERVCGRHGAYMAFPINTIGNRQIYSLCPLCAKAAETANRQKEDEKPEKLVFGPDPVTGVPFRFLEASLLAFQTDGDARKERLIKAFERYLQEFRENRRKGRSLILYGECGTGKTHLACAMVQNLKEQGFKTQYTTAKKMGQRIKKTFNAKNNDDEQGRIMQVFYTVDLLVIDEVMGTEFETGLVQDVVEERYLNMLPTILCTNFGPEEMADPKVLGERVVSRNEEAGGAFVHFEWESYRPLNKNPKRPGMRTIEEMLEEKIQPAKAFGVIEGKRREELR